MLSALESDFVIGANDQVYYGRCAKIFTFSSIVAERASQTVSVCLGDDGGVCGDRGVIV